MSIKFRREDKVVQVMPEPVSGTIADITIDQDGGEVRYMVVDGEGHSRWFSESELAAQA